MRSPSQIFVREQDIHDSSGRKRIVFGWYGGKYSHLNWLLPLLPECAHYCEPYAGSAAVLLNRQPAPMETYNDIDGQVVNFFRVLRDNKDVLIEALALTPYSREEYYIALSGEHVDDIEAARRFYVIARQTHSAVAQLASLGRWSSTRNTSRNGMAIGVSRWWGGIEKLEDVAHRLLRVQIENRPATEVIDKYDSEETLFYCDPPYIHAARVQSKAYGHEMSDMDHIELSDTLNACKGKVAVSGYDHPFMDQLFPGWNKTYAPTKQAPTASGTRTEVLWTNYEVVQ